MKLIKYLKPYWYFALLAPLMMVVEVVVDLSQPTLMSVIVDNGVVAGDMAVITATGIKMIILVIIGGIGGLSASFFANAAAQSFGCDLRCDAYKKVTSLSLEQTDKFTTGSLVTRLTNDVTAVENLVSMALRMFIRAPLNFIGGIVMAIALDVKFSIVIAVALPIELVLIVLIVGKASPMFSKVQKKLDRVNSVVQENVSGARVVKAYVREEHEIGRFDTANTGLYKTNMYVQKLLALISPLMMIIMNASVIAIIVIGGYQVQAGAYEVGKVMAAITYVTQILMSLMMVSMMFQFISRASASAKRIKEILDCEPVVASPDKPVDAGAGENGGVRGSVEFENVSFRYPGTSGSPVLENVNLKIEPGEFVAVLGATGAGKTSLVNLIPRFYDVTGGRVLLDGVDVRDYPLDGLRARIAPVLQKSELYAGTIADNIRMGDENASDDEVEAAAKTAQADSFITSFGGGYGAEVSEKGASLSGGQKQRISIARALVRKPEVLIFDDSTSALDFGTEAALRGALRKNNSDTTIIMIAQRIASVMHADKIAVLENGRITAFDTHEALMKSSQTYRDIYDSQIKNGGNGDE